MIQGFEVTTSYLCMVAKGTITKPLKICFFRYEKLKDQKEAEAKAQEEAKQKEEEDKSKIKWTLLDIFN